MAEKHDETAEVNARRQTFIDCALQGVKRWSTRKINALLFRRDCALTTVQDACQMSDFASDAATWRTGRNIRVVSDSCPFAQLCGNVTSSTKRKYIT